MKAWVLYGAGDLRPADLPAPEPRAGEALVRVKRAGICSSDLPRVFANGAYHYPIVLGHEFSGVAERVCDARDSHLLGKRVAAFPLLPCFKCASCLRGLYETCSDYGYIGSRQNGAFAEFVVVPARNLIELPDAIDFERAAMIEPAAVALHAVRRFDVRGIDSAAAVGTGTIGRLAARWMEIFGVRTVALVGRGDAPAREFDLCVEAVGSASALRRCVELLRPNGMLVSVGNPDADFNLPQSVYRQILRKQLSVKGSWNASFPSDWEETLRRVPQLGLQKLVSHRYAFRDLRRAFAMLRDGREKRGKVLISYDEISE